jgi:hypothetical protein
MIADLNQVRLTKMAGRRFQEVILVYFRLSAVWIILRNPGGTE